MDYESLIADLQKISQMNSISHYKRDVCAAAAIALSTLQAENLDLQAQKVRWFQINRAQEEQIDNLEAGNEKLRAELEQVKEERDAVVESIPHECKTCVYHTVFFNGCTPDYDCTNPDGGCSNNYDRWRWRGPQKED